MGAVVQPGRRGGQRLCSPEKGKRFRLALPKQAEYIIEKLEANGFEAYAVGGCVRDSLLGRQPGDWDIATRAAPQEVKAIFARTIDTGIAHGTVTVMRGREAYEVTTYRIDGEYEDGRHPRDVSFTPYLEEDLKRRDFTINAMAYSHRCGLIDIFGGERDLREKRIRCVGDPRDRFNEDALRILRAFRFSAQLGFEIESKTREALRELAPNLSHVSKERIQTELTKLLLSAHPEYIRMVFEDGAAPWISETFARIRLEDVQVSGSLPARAPLRWAAILRRQTEETAQDILKELKLDNATIARVKLLVRWWRRPMAAEEKAVRQIMSQMPEDAYDDLLEMKTFCGYIPGSPEDLETIGRLARQIRSRGDCLCLKDLAVTGKDLISRGMKPGKAIGQALDILLGLVLEQPEKNDKEKLLAELMDRGYFDRSGTGKGKKST